MVLHSGPKVAIERPSSNGLVEIEGASELFWRVVLERLSAWTWSGS